MVELTELGVGPDPYTREHVFVKGEFKLAGGRIPYFSISMRAGEATKTLSLPRDIILDPTEPLPLEELFQRELDKERVEKQIVPYLKQPQRIKFFNSLTVAILPADPANPRRILREFPTDDPKKPPVDPRTAEAFDIKQVGPVRVLELKGNPRVGRISWNTVSAKAVVIDGQHRLAAIKQVLEDHQYRYRSELEESEVSVLLLVLDPRVGFEAIGPQVGSVLRTVRAVFVDLNRHAIPVPKARNYLLDDRDPIAICMRAVMETQVGGAFAGKDTLARVRDSGVLPVALVDWYSDEAKFDKGIHFTTVLCLYDIVRSCLSLPAYDPMDYDGEVDELIKILRARFGVDADLEGWKSLCEADQLPFVLRAEHLTALRESFRKNWSPAIAIPLVGLRAYAELAKEYEQLGILGGEHEVWTALDDTGKSAYEKEKAPQLRQQVLQIVEKAKKDELSFQVVYQKAFLGALFEMHEGQTDEIGWQKGKSGMRPSDFTKLWVEQFNRRLGGLTKQTLRAADQHYFWTGAGLKVDGTISWSKASQKAILGFVVTALVAPIDEWIVQGSRDLKANATDWLKNTAWRAIKRGTPSTKLMGLLSSCGRHWRGALERVVEDLARARNQELTKEQIAEEAGKLAAERLAQIAEYVSQSK